MLCSPCCVDIQYTSRFCHATSSASPMSVRGSVHGGGFVVEGEDEDDDDEEAFSAIQQVAAQTAAGSTPRQHQRPATPSSSTTTGMLSGGSFNTIGEQSSSMGSREQSTMSAGGIGGRVVSSVGGTPLHLSTTRPYWSTGTAAQPGSTQGIVQGEDSDDSRKESAAQPAAAQPIPTAASQGATKSGRRRRVAAGDAAKAKVAKIIPIKAPTSSRGGSFASRNASMLSAGSAGNLNTDSFTARSASRGSMSTGTNDDDDVWGDEPQQGENQETAAPVSLSVSGSATNLADVAPDSARQEPPNSLIVAPHTSTSPVGSMTGGDSAPPTDRPTTSRRFKATARLVLAAQRMSHSRGGLLQRHLASDDNSSSRRQQESRPRAAPMPTLEPTLKQQDQARQLRGRYSTKAVETSGFIKALGDVLCAAQRGWTRVVCGGVAAITNAAYRDGDEVQRVGVTARSTGEVLSNLAASVHAVHEDLPSYYRNNPNALPY